MSSDESLIAKGLFYQGVNQLWKELLIARNLFFDQEGNQLW